MVAPPHTMRARLAAERELRSATIDFTLAHRMLARAGPDDRLKAEAEKAQKRLKAAEEIVERLARDHP
jgi:hypothetical protein